MWGKLLWAISPVVKYLSTSTDIEVTASSKFTFTQILVIQSLNNFVDFYVDNFVGCSDKTDNTYTTCKVVRHKRFSGDETYILTLLDIVAMKSAQNPANCISYIVKRV